MSVLIEFLDNLSEKFLKLIKGKKEFIKNEKFVELLEKIKETEKNPLKIEMVDYIVHSIRNNDFLDSDDVIHFTLNLYNIFNENEVDWRNKSDEYIKELKGDHDTLEQHYKLMEDPKEKERWDRMLDIEFAKRRRPELYQKYRDEDPFFKQILQVLAHERREAQKPFANDFKSFCIAAIKFDEGDENHRGNNPHWLTSKLHEYKEGYGFSPDNKHDFNNYIGERFSMSRIADLIQETLHDKDLAKHQTILINKKQINGIYIKGEFFNNF